MAANFQVNSEVGDGWRRENLTCGAVRSGDEEMAKEEEEEARPPDLCCGSGEDGGRGRCGEEGGSEPSLSPWLLLGGVGGSWRASSKQERKS